MPRDWTDVFLTGDGAAVPVAAEPEPDQRRGFFRRLRENLTKTRQALGAEIQATLFEGTLDESTWERLEEALIMADVGARTTAEVVSKLEMEAESGRRRGRRGADPPPARAARRPRPPGEGRSTSRTSRP
jgi:fused signal recognition particle receptor